MTSRVKRLIKYLLIAGLVVGAIYAAYQCLVGLAYSTPEVTMVPLGGRWEAETTRWLGGTSWGQTALYRRERGQRELVASIVYSATYEGDDCVLYATPDVGGQSCRIACDDRAPIVVVGRTCERWEVVDGKFRLLEATNAGLVTTASFEAADLKARAKAP